MSTIVNWKREFYGFAVEMSAAGLAPVASDPTAPPEGLLWYNATSHQFKGQYAGGADVLTAKSYVDAQIAALVGGGGAIPAPSGAGKMLYDTGAAFQELAAGTAHQVLHGGAAPGFTALGAGDLPLGCFRLIKNMAGHNGAGACTATGVKVGDKVMVVSFAKVPTAAAATQAGLTAFEATVTVNDQIQQTGAANLSSEAFDVLVLALS
jgi:hypothetical protein